MYASGCGSGIEFVFVGETVVLSFAERGDQLFLTLNPNVPSHSCFDPVTSTNSGQSTFNISGGTGRFEKATGTIVKTFKVIFPAPAPAVKGFFGGFAGTFDGTIKVTK